MKIDFREKFQKKSFQVGFIVIMLLLITLLIGLTIPNPIKQHFLSYEENGYIIANLEDYKKEGYKVIEEQTSVLSYEEILSQYDTSIYDNDLSDEFVATEGNCVLTALYNSFHQSSYAKECMNIPTGNKLFLEKVYDNKSISPCIPEENISYTDSGIAVLFPALYTDLRTISEQMYKKYEGLTLNETVNVVNQTFKNYNYNIKIENRKFKNFNFDELRNNLKAGKPITLTLVGSKVYSNHMMAVLGYTIIKKDDENAKTFVKVANGWTSSLTYIELDNVIKVNELSSFQYFE